MRLVPASAVACGLFFTAAVVSGYTTAPWTPLRVVARRPLFPAVPRHGAAPGGLPQSTSFDALGRVEERRRPPAIAVSPRPARTTRLIMMASAAPAPSEDGPGASADAQTAAQSTPTQQQQRHSFPGFAWARRKVSELRSKTKSDLAASGAAAGATLFCSYGLVSNVNACVLVSCTWASYRALHPALSPLSDTAVFSNPLTWFPLKAAFLAYYLGFYATIGSVLRPFRFGLAIAFAPQLDKLYSAVARRLRARKAVGFLLVTLVVNIMSPCLLLVAGVNLACAVVGVAPVPLAGTV